MDNELKDYALYERNVAYKGHETLGASGYRLASVLVGITPDKAIEIVDKLHKMHSDIEYELEVL